MSHTVVWQTSSCFAVQPSLLLCAMCLCSGLGNSYLQEAVSYWQGTADPVLNSDQCRRWPSEIEH